MKKNKKKLGLTTKIFIALILGALLGIVLYNLPSSSIHDDIVVDGILYVIGQGFIKLMKMLVVPLVFCSLVCGSMAIGDTKKLGSVGVRTIIFYLLTTAIAITVAHRHSKGDDTPSSSPHAQVLDDQLKDPVHGAKFLLEDASVSFLP